MAAVRDGAGGWAVGAGVTHLTRWDSDLGRAAAWSPPD